MSRPLCCRRVSVRPQATVFKPVEGIEAGEVFLSLDELEAIRLADLEGMYQEEAAARMNVSRPTFGRIVEASHKKIADALVTGKTLRIGSDPENIQAPLLRRCSCCKHEWKTSTGIEDCPHCKCKKQNCELKGTGGCEKGCCRHNFGKPKNADKRRKS